VSVLTLPKIGQHIALVGSTGSGKSEFAQMLLRRYDSNFIIDTQDSLDVEGRILHDPHGLQLKLKLFKKLHYVPSKKYMDRDWWDYVFQCLSASSSKKKPHPRVIYIDELYHLGYGSSFPVQIPKTLTTARQRSLSMFISTQRPRMIPMPVLSEATYIFVFYLSKWEDIELIASYGRKSKKDLIRELEHMEDDFSFIRINNRKGTWDKFPALKLN
jgi:ABC-type dipeptide/oligopeptide/nickel transport system ATPase component